MPTDNPRLSVTFTPEQYEQLKGLAGKKHMTMAELVRQWTEQGINGNLNADNINLITQILRTQLKDTMTPEIERLAKLNAKTCVQAGTAAYLSAEAILKFVPDNKQTDVEIAYEKARKKAVAYLKGKTD